MRLAWRLARREVRRRPGRTVLVVALIATVVGGITVGDLSLRSHRRVGTSGWGQAAAVISLTDQGWRPGLPADRAMRKLREALPAGTGAEFGFSAWVPVVRADDGSRGNVAELSTVDFRRPLLRGAIDVTAGRLPAGGEEVLLSQDLATALHAELGDRVALAAPTFTMRVVGVGRIADDLRREVLLAPGYPVEALRPDRVSATAYVREFVSMPTSLNGESGDGIFASLSVAHQFDRPVPLTQLLLLWLGCTLVLGVLGSVVAAAFAASGRRQLVTIGQLGAMGGEQRFVRRFLALQGSITSLVGAAVGVAVGFGVAAAVGDPVLRYGVWGIAPLDLLFVVATTVVVGTASALLPTRALAAAPVLAALAGRAPMRRVRPRQVVLGGVALIAGLVGLALAVTAGKHREGGSAWALALAMLSGATVMGGTFAVTPAVVDRWGRVAQRTSGVRRLALRSIVRHRARSASLVAAVAAIGAVGVAGASLVERYAHDYQQAFPVDSPRFVYLSPRYSGNETVAQQGAPLDDGDAASAERAGVGTVVPGIEWTEVEVARRSGSMGPFGEDFTVATDAALRAYGVPSDMWVTLQSQSDVVVLTGPGVVAAPVGGRPVPGLVVTRLQMVPPSLAASTDWQRFDNAFVGRAPAGLTDDQRSRLLNLASLTLQDSVFVGYEARGWIRNLTWGMPPSERVVSPLVLRWAVMGGLVLLFGMIVSIGLALWAAEGRVERDQLVALGAPPGTLAGVAGVRAWAVVTTGSLLAVALGWSVLWVLFDAADPFNRPPFPWLTVTTMVLVLPLVLGAASVLASSAAQRFRPVRGSSMALD